MRGKNHLGRGAAISRQGLESVTDPTRHRFYESRMVVKHPDLVKSHSLLADGIKCSRNILAILSAAGI
jgi:hypothetical protein